MAGQAAGRAAAAKATAARSQQTRRTSGVAAQKRLREAEAGVTPMPKTIEQLSPLVQQLGALAYGGSGGATGMAESNEVEHIPGVTDGLTLDELSRMLALRGSSAFNRGRRLGGDEARAMLASRWARERPQIVAGAMDAVLESLAPVLEGMAARDPKTREAARDQLVALAGEIASSARKMQERAG